MDEKNRISELASPGTWIGATLAVLGAIGAVAGVLSSLGWDKGEVLSALGVGAWALLIPLLVGHARDHVTIGRLRKQVELLRAERREDRETIAADRGDRASLIAILQQCTARDTGAPPPAATAVTRKRKSSNT